MPLWAAASLRGERIALLRDQAARMEALANAAPRFEALSREIASDARVQALAYHGAQAEVSVADLQATLNRIFSDAGATVTRGQAISAAGGRIAVETAVEADIAALVRALHAIGGARPLLTIEKLSSHEPDGEWALAKPVGPQPKVANKLAVEVVVSAFVRRTS
jgi:hypothetical protein